MFSDCGFLGFIKKKKNRLANYPSAGPTEQLSSFPGLHLLYFPKSLTGVRPLLVKLSHTASLKSTLQSSLTHWRQWRLIQGVTVSRCATCQKMANNSFTCSAPLQHRLCWTLGRITASLPPAHPQLTPKVLVVGQTQRFGASHTLTRLIPAALWHRHRHHYPHYTDEDTEVQQGCMSQDTELAGGRSWTVPGLSSLKSLIPLYSSLVLSLSRELESPGACESWRLPSPTSRRPCPEGLGGISESASATSAWDGPRATYRSPILHISVNPDHHHKSEIEADSSSCGTGDSMTLMGTAQLAPSCAVLMHSNARLTPSATLLKPSTTVIWPGVTLWPLEGVSRVLHPWIPQGPSHRVYPAGSSLSPGAQVVSGGEVPLPQRRTLHVTTGPGLALTHQPLVLPRSRLPHQHSREQSVCWRNEMSTDEQWC